jgi:hypothetical protein
MRYLIFELALVGVFCTHEEGNLGVSGFSTFATNSLPPEVPSAFYTDSTSSQENAYGTGFSSSMAVAAPDGVLGCAAELMENSNFAATKAVETAAYEGPRPGHILHEGPLARCAT